MNALSPRRPPASTDRFGLRSVARTHIGAVRTINEDRLLDCSEAALWAVADGMGGHAMGDEAAAIVIRALVALSDDPELVDRAGIQRSIESANAIVFGLAQATGQTCGSTLAGLHIHGGLATIFWAGDSRVYRMRADRLERLTHDHSFVQELVDAGVIDEQQARNHPQANIVTRAIGVAEHIALDFTQERIAAGDLYLLCSDGLWGLLDDEQIRSLLTSNLADASAKLVDGALRAGGTDNVSIVLVLVSEVQDHDNFHGLKGEE